MVGWGNYYYNWSSNSIWIEKVRDSLYSRAYCDQVRPDNFVVWQICCFVGWVLIHNVA